MTVLDYVDHFLCIKTFAHVSCTSLVLYVVYMIGYFSVISGYDELHENPF